MNTGLSPILSIEDLSFGYPKHPPLFQNLTLRIPIGDAVALEGASGAGKSTLAHCILRLLQPQQGTIQIGEHDITSLKEKYLRPLRRHFQPIFQPTFLALNPSLKVITLLHEPLLLHHAGLSKRGRQEKIEILLEALQIPSLLLERYASQLSGGERQKIAFLRAALVDPLLLICDEPLAGIDRRSQLEILKFLERIKKEKAILWISHDPETSERLCSRIYSLKDGMLMSRERYNLVNT